MNRIRNSQNENNNFGFLAGATEKNSSQQRRQQRAQNYKNTQNSQPGSQLNAGAKGTMIINSQQSNSDYNPNQIQTMQIQPGMLSKENTQKLNLPPDVQEKINRWREKRQARQQLQNMTQYDNESESNQYQESNYNDTDERRAHNIIRGRNNNNNTYQEQHERQPIMVPQQSGQNLPSQNRSQHNIDHNDFDGFPPNNQSEISHSSPSRPNERSRPKPNSNVRPLSIPIIIQEPNKDNEDLPDNDNTSFNRLQSKPPARPITRNDFANTKPVTISGAVLRNNENPMNNDPPQHMLLDVGLLTDAISIAHESKRSLDVNKSFSSDFKENLKPHVPSLFDSTSQEILKGMV
jgi:hypothetical protein